MWASLHPVSQIFSPRKAVKHQSRDLPGKCVFMALSFSFIAGFAIGVERMFEIFMLFDFLLWAKSGGYMEVSKKAKITRFSFF